MSFKTFTLASALLVATTGFAAAESHGSAPAVTGKLDGETFLMTSGKMTLYTFDKDERGVSNCYDACATKWPPLMGQAGMNLARGYSLIERNDGSMQVAYKHQPLYTWFKDQHPGDMTGDGVKGVWHTARP